VDEQPTIALAMVIALRSAPLEASPRHAIRNPPT